MRLYAVLLGGSGGSGRLSEDHETVFVVAEDERSATQAAKQRWSGHGRPHVDALVALESVDGWQVELREGGSEADGALVDYNDEPYDEAD
jgi:hypothetical protein